MYISCNDPPPPPPKETRLCGQNVIFTVEKLIVPIFTALTAPQYN